MEMDALTGIMGRRMFLHHCDMAQKTNAQHAGWFLFVDVDYFKAINDTLGHSTGDKVLREIAQKLQHTFEDTGKVGRLGGDEFAVLIEQLLTPEDLKQRLEQFLKDISTLLSDRTVSCSIGACQFTFPKNVNHLLGETDVILYQAKEKGRACYVIKTCGADE